MQVETMQMDPRIARVHFLDYRKRVREHRLEREKQNDTEATTAGKALRVAQQAKARLAREDDLLMQAYKAMSLGQRVLNLTSVLTRAGVDHEHFWLPKLAVAGADWGKVFFSCNNFTTDATFSRESWFLRRRRDSTDAWKDARPVGDVISFPQNVFAPETYNLTWRREQKIHEYPAYAVVPSVPVQLRPSGDLGDYQILWDAPGWQFYKRPPPPLDPLLLKHIDGDFYTVVAQWDLTPLERSILEGRVT